MCVAASFIITKGFKVHWSRRTDSHIEIRTEHGIPENSAERITSVQAEISPPDKNYALPFDKWTFRTNQDLMPDWWYATEGERMTRIALEEWAKARLVRDGEIREKIDGTDNVLAVLGRVGSVQGSGSVGSVQGSGRVGSVLGSGRVGSVQDSGSVGSVRDSGSVGYVKDSASVSFACSFSVILSGFCAVIIDQTGKKARCIVGTAKERVVKGGVR